MNDEALRQLNRLVKSQTTKEKSTGTGDGILKSLCLVIGSIALFLAIVVFGIWSTAFVGSTLWLWFIVPTFSLPAISLPIAFGISTLIKFWVHEVQPKFTSDAVRPYTKLEHVLLLLSPWISLMIGYFCKIWFMAN